MNITLFVTMAIFSWGGNDSVSVNNSAFNFTLKSMLNHTVPVIGVEQLLSKSDRFILLDAREPEEHSVSSIQGARHVGFEHFDISCLDDLDFNTPVVIYCSIGLRSEKIGEQLITAGFTEVYNLYGGIFEWVNQDNPVHINDLQTPRIHAYNRIWGIWLQKGEKVY